MHQQQQQKIGALIANNHQQKYKLSTAATTIIYMSIEQRFSTFGCLRPTKQNISQIDLQDNSIKILKYMFW